MARRTDDGRRIGACDYCGDEGIFPKTVRILRSGGVDFKRLPGDLTKLGNGLVRCDSCEVDTEVAHAENQGRKKAS